MRVKKTIAFLLILFLPGFLGLGGTQEKSTDEKRVTNSQKSLIRKDLLMKKKEVPQPPRRNIFSPRGIGISEEDMSSLISPRDFEEQDATTGEEMPFYEMSLRYIGYVDTGERIVALVIFEGEAVAVEEGEMISEQFKVGKVTRDKLNVIGPGGEIKEFPLEGE